MVATNYKPEGQKTLWVASCLQHAAGGGLHLLHQPAEILQCSGAVSFFFVVLEKLACSLPALVKAVPCTLLRQRQQGRTDLC